MCKGQGQSFGEACLLTPRPLTPSLPTSTQMCSTDGNYVEMHDTDYVSFSPNEWYKISFTVVGDRLSCALYAADDNAVAYGEPLISHELAPLNGSKYSGIVNEAGAPEFGTYSNSLYFARFGFQDLE